MKTNFFSMILTTVITLGLSSGNAKSTVEIKTSPYVKGVNTFGLKLFKTLAKDNDNVLISPLSLVQSLSMVGHFAQSSDQAALRTALGLDGLSTQEFAEQTREILLALKNANSSSYQLNVANSFWLDRSLTPESAALSLLMDIYRAPLNNNFRFTEASSSEAINKWVIEATQNKITELVSAEELSQLKWLSLNAVYFSGQWFRKFKHYRGIYPYNFETAAKRKVNVVYLTTAATPGVSAYYGGDYAALELMYGSQTQPGQADTRGTMILIKPQYETNFEDFVQNFTYEKFLQARKGLIHRRDLEDGNTGATLPAFEASFEINHEPVQKLLTQLGAGSFFSAFDMTSLNPILSENRGNKISLIKQKANIVVNDTGTVATAATATGGDTESSPPHISFDSPFIYFVVDEKTGVILFAGTVTDPSKLKVPPLN